MPRSTFYFDEMALCYWIVHGWLSAFEKIKQKVFQFMLYYLSIS